MTPRIDPLWTLDQTAEYLGVSMSTLRDLWQRDGLPVWDNQSVGSSDIHGIIRCGSGPVLDPQVRGRFVSWRV